MVFGSTQPLAEMNAKNLSRIKGRPARKADNDHLFAGCLEKVESSTSFKRIGLYGL
jgi:hypothetical protein